MNKEEKINFYNDIISMHIKYVDIKGFLIDYEINKELAIFILILKIKKAIVEFVKNTYKYQVDKEDPKIKLYLENLKEAENHKKVENYITSKNSIEKPTKEEIELYEKIKQLDKDYDANKLIKEISEKINLISKIESKSFSNYFNNFSKFLADTKDDFDEKFKDIANLKNDDF